ncbi:MAG: hypothetical protein JO192_12515 [Candidatus Eremiobacteraeota bacterium]|nr:hypothetical protein [Candidatus Eremiobacteraeota bacterium]MBV8721729.1 hypothetical protein [Candidatus Eremiobacteraeota bacterium]
MNTTVLAGLFLMVFGAAGAWFLTTRFPSARFLRAGYLLMAAGGCFFVLWGLWSNVVVGLAAAALLALGAVVGVVGTLRRELRPPV